MMQRFVSVFVAVVVVGVASGCRSYGGYGSEEAIYRQIHTANDEFADQIESVKSQQDAIVAAALGLPDGGQIQSDLDLIVETHEVLLQRHREQAERLSASRNYRDLRRAYMAVISDKETFRDMVLRLQWFVADGAGSSGGPDIPYQIVPVFYDQIARAGHSARGARSPYTPGDRELSGAVQEEGASAAAGEQVGEEEQGPEEGDREQ